MALSDSQAREVGQLLLGARAYLKLGDPEDEDGEVRLGDTKDAFLPGAQVGLADWVRTMQAAHLASAAVRLASVDEVLAKAGMGRELHQQCQQYFGTGWKKVPDDPRGTFCGEWFHIMLRDAVGHREPPQQEEPAAGLVARYGARRQMIEATTLGEAHARLERTAEELAESLAARGIELPQLGH